MTKNGVVCQRWDSQLPHGKDLSVSTRSPLLFDCSSHVCMPVSVTVSWIQHTEIRTSSSLGAISPKTTAGTCSSALFVSFDAAMTLSPLSSNSFFSYFGLPFKPSEIPMAILAPGATPQIPKSDSIIATFQIVFTRWITALLLMGRLMNAVTIILNRLTMWVQSTQLNQDSNVRLGIRNFLMHTRIQRKTSHGRPSMATTVEILMGIPKHGVTQQTQMSGLISATCHTVKVQFIRMSAWIAGLKNVALWEWIRIRRRATTKVPRT